MSDVDVTVNEGDEVVEPEEEKDSEAPAEGDSAEAPADDENEPGNPTSSNT